MRTIWLVLSLTFALQLPSLCQEASDLGLTGPVNAVFTENFRAEGGASQPTGSSYEIFDRRGYLLEVFLYKPDGSLWVHTMITRNGTQIFRSQTIGTAPFESYSEENFFDATGRAIETDEYDGNGILKKRTTWPVEDIGVLPKDEITVREASHDQHEREVYESAAGDHKYQKTDAQGHVIEVSEQSETNFIRCTYTYDEKGRHTGQINYDASGKVIDKTTTEYVDDPFGNWIEQRKLLWNTNTELPSHKVAETSFRKIDYY